MGPVLHKRKRIESLLDHKENPSDPNRSNVNATKQFQFTIQTIPKHHHLFQIQAMSSQSKPQASQWKFKPPEKPAQARRISHIVNITSAKRTSQVPWTPRTRSGLTHRSAWPAFSSPSAFSRNWDQDAWPRSHRAEEEKTLGGATHKREASKNTQP